MYFSADVVTGDSSCQKESEDLGADAPTEQPPTAEAIGHSQGNLLSTSYIHFYVYHNPYICLYLL